MPDRLIVRLPNWLGDTVMAVPTLESLRAAFPVSHIVAAGPWISILEGQGLVDALVPYPRDWRGRRRAAGALRHEHTDVVVVLPNSLESAIAARLWRARRSVGFATDARGWLLTDRVPRPAERLHQIDEYLLLVERLGAAATTREPRLAAPGPDSASRREIRTRLADIGVEVDPRAARVGIHLGAAFGAAKLWPPERVIELCRRLRGDGDVPLLMGPADSAAVAARIVSETEAPSFVGRDRQDLLVALLSEVDVLVGGDTGITHLAAALGTPAVALFGPTDPALSAPRGPTVVLRHPVPCAPCFYRTCPIDHPCMRGIDAGAVADALRRLARARATR